MDFKGKERTTSLMSNSTNKFRVFAQIKKHPAIAAKVEQDEKLTYKYL